MANFINGFTPETMAAQSRKTTGVKPLIRNLLADEAVWVDIDKLAECVLPPLDYQFNFVSIFTSRDTVLADAPKQDVYDAAKALVNKDIKAVSLAHHHTSTPQIRNGRVKRVELMLTDKRDPQLV